MSAVSSSSGFLHSDARKSSWLVKRTVAGQSLRRPCSWSPGEHDVTVKREPRTHVPACAGCLRGVFSPPSQSRSRAGGDSSQSLQPMHGAGAIARSTAELLPPNSNPQKPPSGLPRNRRQPRNDACQPAPTFVYANPCPPMLTRHGRISMSGCIRYARTRQEHGPIQPLFFMASPPIGCVGIVHASQHGCEHR